VPPRILHRGVTSTGHGPRQSPPASFFHSSDTNEYRQSPRPRPLGRFGPMSIVDFFPFPFPAPKTGPTKTKRSDPRRPSYNKPKYTNKLFGPVDKVSPWQQSPKR